MIWIGVVALGAGLAAFLILHRFKARGWSAVTNDNDYGAKVERDGSFDFPQAPDSVHYVTKACGPLIGRRIRLRYKIDGGPFFPASNPAQAATGPTIYFQRKGDDWSGVGKYDGYRWYATFASPSPIVAGEFEIIAPFSEEWSGVEDYNSFDQHPAFLAALNNAARVGFVFGGGTGYGHGVYGSGRFTLLGFAVE